MRLKILISLMSLFISQSVLANFLEYHGYFRSGVGTNSLGGDQVCFDTEIGRNEFRLEMSVQTTVRLLFKEIT